MNNNSTTQEKKKVLEKLLNESFVLIQVNTQAIGVDLPADVKLMSNVTLKISRYFRGRMDVIEKGVVAELLFSGEYYTCVIPYTAIIGMCGENGENYSWSRQEVESDLIGDEKKEESTEKIQYGIQHSMPQNVRAFPAKGHLRRIK